jgi:methylated-DNA-[protein]-cysteine S-methyltransferase
MNSTTHYYTSFPTPVGTFSLSVDEHGAITATAFGDREALQGRLGEGVLLEDQQRTAPARREVHAWFKGQRRDFSVPLAPRGSAFQQRVWAELARIPFGETRSYGDLARLLKSAPRAVGRANATNPISLLIPCHRVIGANGKLTGYAFGETTKRRLLDFEAA